jgi:hypothetical protein
LFFCFIYQLLTKYAGKAAARAKDVGALACPQALCAGKVSFWQIDMNS